MVRKSGAGFQHMRGETCRSVCGDTCFLMPACLAASAIAAQTIFFSDGHISPPICSPYWEQVGLRLHPAPVLAQSVQKLGGQQNIAIAAALALMDMNDHARAVDVGDLQMTPTRLFAALSHTASSASLRCIKLRAESISRATSSGLSTMGSFLGALGKRNLIEQVGAPKGLHEEKAQGCTSAPGWCQATASDRGTDAPGTPGCGLGQGGAQASGGSI